MQPCTVGQNLENFTTCSLSGAAPSDLTVTLTSNDPSKLLLSATDPTAAGSASISRTDPGRRQQHAAVLCIWLGQQRNGNFQCQRRRLHRHRNGDAGEIRLCPGDTVRIGCRFHCDSRRCADRRNGADGAARRFRQLRRYTGLGRRAYGQCDGDQFEHLGWAQSAVRRRSSPAANNSANVQFQGVSAGTTTLTAVTPAGYTTPAQFATVNVTVGQPRIAH